MTCSRKIENRGEMMKEEGAKPSFFTGVIIKWRHLVFLVILIGVFFRFGEYIPDRSLWLDEAITVNRISGIPLAQLINGRFSESLAYPFGFLFFLKTALILFGSNNEIAMRFFPFLAGLFSLFFFYPLALKVLNPNAALFALFLFSINPMLSYYSSEVKPYSFDVLFVMAICWILLESSHIKKWVLYAGLVFMAMWFSYGACFTLFGAGIPLFCYALWSQRKEDARYIGWLLFAGAVSISANYFFFLRYFIFKSGLSSYWGFVYPSFLSITHAFIWVWNLFALFFRIVLNYPFFPGLVFSLFGAAALYQKNKVFFIMCFGTVMFLLAASMFHIYPFFGRLVVFLVPLFSILIAASLERCLMSRKRVNIILGVALAAVAVFFPLRVAIRQFSEPFAQQEIKPVLDFVSEKRKQEQKIYVFNRTRSALKYYMPRYNFSNEDFIYGQASGPDRQAYERDLEKISAYKYAWVLYSHILPEEARILTQAIERYNGIPVNSFCVKSVKGLPPGYMKKDGFTAGTVLYNFRDRTH